MPCQQTDEWVQVDANLFPKKCKEKKKVRGVLGYNAGRLEKETKRAERDKRTRVVACNNSKISKKYCR
jgi:hypothetical protein